MKKNILIYIVLFSSVLSGSCDFLFGTREDIVTDEIFEEGAIDPDLVQDEVGYVPILPFWNDFNNPTDIYCGYDEMIYVIDDNLSLIHISEPTRPY